MYSHLNHIVINKGLVWKALIVPLIINAFWKKGCWLFELDIRFCCLYIMLGPILMYNGGMLWSYRYNLYDMTCDNNVIDLIIMYYPFLHWRLLSLFVYILLISAYGFSIIFKSWDQRLIITKTFQTRCFYMWFWRYTINFLPDLKSMYA